jgi:hypothetical protein
MENPCVGAAPLDHLMVPFLPDEIGAEPRSSSGSSETAIDDTKYEWTLKSIHVCRVLDGTVHPEQQALSVLAFPFETTVMMTKRAHTCIS